jgi:hypothetical protein
VFHRSSLGRRRIPLLLPAVNVVNVGVAGIGRDKRLSIRARD